jgi:bifunctional DNase/RNase
MDDMQTVEVLGLYVDPGSGSAVVLLAEPERGARVLPVFVGPFEATAIAIGIEQSEVARPGTHDLLIAALRAAGAHVVGARVVSLHHGTFIGAVDVETEHGIEHVDARPSDAIALAVRVGAPVLVDRGTFASAAVDVTHDIQEPFDEAEIEDIVSKFAEFLESAEPEQFGEPPTL